MINPLEWKMKSYGELLVKNANGAKMQIGNYICNISMARIPGYKAWGVLGSASLFATPFVKGEQRIIAFLAGIILLWAFIILYREEERHK